MIVYWIIFCSLALIAASNSTLHFRRVTSSKWSLCWLFTLISLSIIIGLRYRVGVDWDNYISMLDQTTGEPLYSIALQSDPGYACLNWIGANIWGGIYFTNTAAALLFLWGLIQFAKSQPHPWLVLVVSMPYLITVVGMGYNRQAIAIGLIMAAFVSIFEGRIIKCYFLVGFAALFHKSAVLLIIIALLNKNDRLWLRINVVLVFSLGLYYLLADQYVDRLYSVYIDAEYESAGALTRIAMNAIPATIFLLLRSKFRLSEVESKLWTGLCWLSISFIIILKLSPSSTAVDRVALYLQPLQLFVFGRLPIVLAETSYMHGILVITVILYSATVLLGWIVLSPYSYFWIPYRFFE